MRKLFHNDMRDFPPNFHAECKYVYTFLLQKIKERKDTVTLDIEWLCK